MSIVTQPPYGSMLGGRAAFLRNQINWTLLALIPGAVLHAWFSGNTILLAIGCAIAWALLLEAFNGTGDGMQTVHWQRLSNAILMGALCALWLPPTLPWWTFAISIFAAVALVRVFLDRPGASPFHPAMAGCAIALLFTPHIAPAAVHGPMSTWIAVAYACSGIVLMAARRIRWQVPLTILASAVIVAGAVLALPSRLAPGFGGSIDSAVSMFQQLLPALVLTIVFIASDPSSGCALPRARWLFGIGTGLLMAVSIIVFPEVTGASLGIAGAVLLMNAAAPWLDRTCAGPVPTRSRADTDRQ